MYKIKFHLDKIIIKIHKKKKKKKKFTNFKLKFYGKVQNVHHLI